MMNRVLLTGRLTRDPELRYTPNGVAVATFTIAVNRTYTNQQGEREADFVNIVVWRKSAENCANFLRKGSLVGVDGRLTTRNYEGQDGKRVYVTEVTAENVTFLEPRNAQGGNGGGQGQGQGQGQGGQGGGQTYNRNQGNRNSNQGGQNSNQGYNRNQGNQNSNQGNNQGNGQNHPANQNQNPIANQNQSFYDDDPFANGSGGIDISDDDLPF